uniref:SHSP domain-containing protein n=1 Tax=Romanomermis culicivorax TaxID=13658 RepID=A0A915K155_ROMCU
MSLIPYLTMHPVFRTGDWWDASTLGRLFDQDFGGGILDDDPLFRAMLPSSMLTNSGVAPYWLRSRTHPLVSGLERGLSEVRNDADKFSVNMDVGHFAPEEIKVKVVDNNLIVDGKHEEKSDEHGFISRSFKRRYILPKDVDPATLTSNLTDRGVLRIEAPKKALEQPKERPIPIQRGGDGDKAPKAVQK